MIRLFRPWGCQSGYERVSSLHLPLVVVATLVPGDGGYLPKDWMISQLGFLSEVDPGQGMS